MLVTTTTEDKDGRLAACPTCAGRSFEPWQNEI